MAPTNLQTVLLDALTFKRLLKCAKSKDNMYLFSANVIFLAVVWQPVLTKTPIRGLINMLSQYQNPITFNCLILLKLTKISMTDIHGCQKCFGYCEL